MKVAISLPDSVFNAAELLAKELRVPRSQLYAQALSAYLVARGSAAVTAKLNELYGSENSAVEPAMLEAQRRVLADEAW